ncbi:hypothetical protein GP486_007727 [Trichoglossum hirsutum]|uniref:Dynamin N-terminal domain-containing protein n=1 Tax=Trichoglossum hirsutum TaxID=265104 RepID=A0A9P8IHV1_9PEZI|nr:hypothetical protein GP486_007727 [Trichoglossum hirsutum]
MAVMLNRDEALALHQKASALKPKEDCKPSTYWIGILHHDKTHESFEKETDFLWVKCHKKITTETIRQTYLSRFPGTAIMLMDGAGVVHGSMTMGSLNRYGDNIVILRAVYSSPIQQPLQPAHYHGTVKLASPDQLECESTDSARFQRSPENFPNQNPIPPFNDLGSQEENHESQKEWPESESSKTEDAAVSGNAQLQALAQSDSPETLERAVEAGLSLLEPLGEYFGKQVQPTQDSAHWLQQIEEVKAQASKTRTVVGVVGNTGAGKSSIINAILDEERLVPTNCMRACTAVVTEISYNASDDPQKKYSAEIEFIGAADWQKELRILFGELIDANGKISRDRKDKESEAGIAYAKIRAVYPRKTKDDLVKSSVEFLMDDPSVRDLFGTTREIHCSEPKTFYAQLQRYADSREKSTEQKEKDKKGKKGRKGHVDSKEESIELNVEDKEDNVDSIEEPAGQNEKDGKGKKDKKRRRERREMEFWPLIRVVKIYVKAPALSTGAVIVDLPGVHDQNVARAAVAESYMKQCTGLWIVAPITRAVDDKAAKDLLGRSFKQQLKMDGAYNSVTFICSKTDDVSVEEATDSLGLNEELSDLSEQLQNCRSDRKRLTVELSELKEGRAVYRQVMESTEEQLDLWEDLKDDVERGKIVYDPDSGIKNDRKRKCRPPVTKNAKKLRQESHSDEGSNNDSQRGDAGGDPEGCESTTNTTENPAKPKPLTSEEVRSKLNDLNRRKKASRRERAEFDQKIDAAESDLREVECKMDMIRGQMNSLCITERNKYSKGAIQRDFAAGIVSSYILYLVVCYVRLP